MTGHADEKKKVKAGQDGVRRRAVIVNLLVTGLILAAVAYGVYAFVLRGRSERGGGKGTGTEPAVFRSSEALVRAMWWLYPDISGKVKRTYVIPGLNSTETLQGDFLALTSCTSMTPQGMCVTGDYVLISAYCATHRHNSVIYMLDRESGAYIRTIVLGGKAHVGGMAYDPERRNVWVSGGFTGSAKAVCYTLSSFENYDIGSVRAVPDIYNYTLASIARNSYMTYSENALIVGIYETGRQSGLMWFNMTEEGGLKAEIHDYYDPIHESIEYDDRADTSGNIQSAAVSGDTLILSKSMGPFDSALEFHSMEKERGNYTDANAQKTFRFPEKLEQVCVYGGELYCLFEAAAYAYRAEPVLKPDRVLVFDLDDLYSVPEEKI